MSTDVSLSISDASMPTTSVKLVDGANGMISATTAIEASAEAVDEKPVAFEAGDQPSGADIPFASNAMNGLSKDNHSSSIDEKPSIVDSPTDSSAADVKVEDSQQTTLLAEEDEPVVFSVRRSSNSSSSFGPRKTYGSKRRQQQQQNCESATTFSSSLIDDPITAKIVSLCSPLANSGAKNASEDNLKDDNDDDCLPTSSKRIRLSSPLPDSSIVSVDDDDDDDPTPFLGPDVAVIERNSGESTVGETTTEDESADEKPDIIPIGTDFTPMTTFSDAASISGLSGVVPITGLPDGATIVDQSSLITFDLASLLTNNGIGGGGNDGGSGDGVTALANGQKIMTLSNGGVRLLSPSMTTTTAAPVSGGNNGIRVITNGASLVDLPEAVTTMGHDVESGVDDPGAIYIQNLLNGATAYTTTTMMGGVGNANLTTTSLTTMPIAQTGNQQLQQQQRPQEILVDSDDEPEILFVEEKFAKSAPQPLPVSKRKVVASSRPLVKKLGPSILKNIASQPAATSTSNSSVISSAPDKAGHGRVDRAKAKPDYFKDAQNFTIPDKFSYMKIKPQGRKSKRKGPVVDGEVCIPSDQFQRQLRDTTDTVTRISLAPYSKRAMHILEYGGVERAFAMPSEFYRDCTPLASLYNSNLKTHMTEDETEEETRSFLDADKDQIEARSLEVKMEPQMGAPMGTQIGAPMGTPIDAQMVTIVETQKGAQADTPMEAPMGAAMGAQMEGERVEVKLEDELDFPEVKT